MIEILSVGSEHLLLFDQFGKNGKHYIVNTLYGNNTNNNNNCYYSINMHYYK